MGKASSSKKVQRAARAAASSRGTGERRERGFPILVAVIVVLGIGLVVAARESRDPLLSPLVGEHWHSAYEFYDCGTVLPAIIDESGGSAPGIHSHGDGLFHIHPANSAATGEDADIGVFFEVAQLTVTADGVSSSSPVDAGFPGIDNSTGCDGEDSEIVIGRFNTSAGGAELETVYREGFGEIRFLEDGEAFTIAKVPVGEDPPAPSEASLAQLASTRGTLNLLSDNPILPPLEGAETGDDTSDDTGDDPVDDGSDPADDNTTDDDSTTDESGTDESGTDDTTTDEPADDDPPATDGGEGTGGSDGE